MQLQELFLIAVGLSMDAFAVSIAKGLSMKKVRKQDAVLVGVWFGAFQALMPMIGFFFGVRFLERIKAVDHWVAFIILALVGGNMIREALQEEKTTDGDPARQNASGRQNTPGSYVSVGNEISESSSASAGSQKPMNGKADLRARTMVFLAIATSIDALAVGFTFGLLQVKIVPSAMLIGCITFGISVGGVYIGKAFGARFKKGAAIAGGAVLIGIGLKILLEHLGMFA